jgi:hypothetical protein
VKDKPGSPIVKALPLLLFLFEMHLEKQTKMHRENTHTEKKGRPLCIYKSIYNKKEENKTERRENRARREEKRIYIYMYIYIYITMMIVSMTRIITLSPVYEKKCV